MTLSQELRQSIIQQVLSGKQYRDISKEMGISIGSIANIAKKHRGKMNDPSLNMNKGNRNLVM
jgi:DNA-directed RNA polymerase specialized sigma24 family protein